VRGDRGERVGSDLARQIALSVQIDGNGYSSGALLSRYTKLRERDPHLRAAAVLSLSLSLGADDEYHGFRSCLVGASATPRSVSVTAGLDFEARAASAAVCSSRSAKRLMCPLDGVMEEDPDPSATAGAGALASPSSGGGECGGVIPTRERSTPRRDSASCREL